MEWSCRRSEVATAHLVRASRREEAAAHGLIGVQVAVAAVDGSLPRTSSPFSSSKEATWRRGRRGCYRDAAAARDGGGSMAGEVGGERALSGCDPER